ncbi:MAG: MFS transporter [Rhodobacteraceae bacterium]|nr:MFS transporter [Paracoccaceae bacterium]
MPTAPAPVPRAVLALGFVSLLMDVSSEMTYALLPVYLVTVMGAPMAAVGVIEGVAQATAAIVKVFSGALSDWLGRRKALAVLGYGLAALTKPVFPLAPTLGWVVAARFLDRVGKGLRGAPRDAMIADLAPPEARGAAFGLRQSLDLAGAFLGPLGAMAGVWLFAGNLRAVFWVAVLPAFAAVALLIVAVPEPARSARAAARFPLRRAELGRLSRAYWLVTGVAGLLTLAEFSDAFLILKARDVGLPLALVPLTLVGVNLVSSLAAWPAGVLSDRAGRIGVLAAAFPLLIAADLVLGLGTGLAALSLGVALWGLHVGLSQGLLATLVADIAPAGLRGTAYGVFNLITGVALLIASTLAGALWQTAGAGATFLAGAALAAAGLAALGLAHRAIPTLGARPKA